MNNNSIAQSISVQKSCERQMNCSMNGRQIFIIDYSSFGFGHISFNHWMIRGTHWFTKLNWIQIHSHERKKQRFNEHWWNFCIALWGGVMECGREWLVIKSIQNIYKLFLGKLNHTVKMIVRLTFCKVISDIAEGLHLKLALNSTQFHFGLLADCQWE